MDFAALDVRERLDVLELPDDATRPVILRYDPSLDPVMRIGLTGDEELVRLRLIGEREVKRLLERVEGVAAASWPAASRRRSRSRSTSGGSRAWA